MCDWGSCALWEGSWTSTPGQKYQYSECSLGTTELPHESSVPETALQYSAPYPRSWPGRNVRGVALHRPVFVTAPSTHLTDQEEGFRPVLEGASQIRKGLQLCYQSRAPGQWAWEQSGGRKQTSAFTDPTLQSQALIRPTILAMSCFHSTFLRATWVSRKGPRQQVLSRLLSWHCVSGDLSDSPVHLAQTETLETVVCFIFKLIHASFIH